MIKQQPTCKNCGNSFIGRIDKKYCSDHCKNTFHNKEHSHSNNYIRKINYVLRKNRNILEKLNPNGKTSVSKKSLEKDGFNFDYFTHIYTTKAGKTYYFCYEHGYIPIENGYYALVIQNK